MHVNIVLNVFDLVGIRPKVSTPFTRRLLSRGPRVRAFEAETMFLATSFCTVDRRGGKSISPPSKYLHPCAVDAMRAFIARLYSMATYVDSTTANRRRIPEV